MKRETFEMLARLERMGFTPDDAATLRRISMTLHRWHELECGIDDDSGKSLNVERDETTGKPYQRIQYSTRNGWVDRRYPIADREAGALRRLAALMARYPSLSYYVQGDPRGAALYILRPGDVPDGKSADAYYSRGVAVYC